ncbi:hypothetical protein ACLOJK_004176 [Asimina triloba]
MEKLPSAGAVAVRTGGENRIAEAAKKKKAAGDGVKAMEGESEVVFTTGSDLETSLSPERNVNEAVGECRRRKEDGDEEQVGERRAWQ